MPATRSILVGVAEILEIMRLVDKDLVHAKVVEYEPVVLLVPGRQLLQLVLERRKALFERLDDVPALILGGFGLDQKLRYSEISFFRNSS